MEALCDLCGIVRAVVYCKSDLARLCLNCDGDVHSANALSRSHLRSLLCDKCNSQPAIVRCMFDELFVCQSCYSNPNGCSQLGHRYQILSSYTGCAPSLGDLGATDSRSFTSLPRNDSCFNKCLDQPDNSDASFGLLTGKANELEPCVKYDPRMEKYSKIMSPNNNILPSSCCDQTVSFPLDFDLHEASSSVQQVPIALQSSRPSGSVVNVMDRSINSSTNPTSIMNLSCNQNVNPGYPHDQVHPSISASLSNNCGEIITPDHQECGLSPAFLTDVSQLEPNFGSSYKQARAIAIRKYNEKKKNMTFNKKIRYASRKARADIRKRVKGRFVKANEPHDCNPQVTVNS